MMLFPYILKRAKLSGKAADEAIEESPLHQISLLIFSLLSYSTPQQLKNFALKKQLSDALNFWLFPC